MSTRNTWCPGESVVRDLPAPQATQPTGGISGVTDVKKPATEPAGLATPVKAKPKIIRRRTPTVDTSVSCVPTSGGKCSEKQQAEDGRGIVPSTYTTIENSGTCSDVGCIISTLMQRKEHSKFLEGDFHGWLRNDPTLHWNNIFMPKSERSGTKTVKEKTRRQQSEEYIFRHCKDISDYMRYYRNHCMLTSLSNTSLRHSRQKNKQEQPKVEEDKEPFATRPQTQGVYRTIDKDEQYQRSASDRPVTSVNGPYKQQQIFSTHSSKLAELENRLNLRASILFPSKPFTLIPKPTPPSIVNKESSSIVLCGTSSNERPKDDDILHTQSKETNFVKPANDSVELPPINSTYHSSSDSSISLVNYLHIKSHQHQPMFSAKEEMEENGSFLPDELGNESEPCLLSSSSIHLQSKSSSNKLDDGNQASTEEDSWMYPYPHFQAPTPSLYDRMTREQLLSSKAHALGLMSKNWIKTKTNGRVINDGTHQVESASPPMTRLKSSPAGRRGREYTNTAYTPILADVEENHTKETRNSKTKSRNRSKSYATELDTVHNRLKTAGPNTQQQTSPKQRRTNTSHGSRLQKANAPQNHQQSRKKCVVLTSKLSKPKRHHSSMASSRQSSDTYIGQINEQLKGILSVKQEGSPTVSISALQDATACNNS